MLSATEQVIFVILVIVCLEFAVRGFTRMAKIVGRGQPSSRSDHPAGRFVGALVDIVLQKPIFKTRPLVSFFHSFLFFGFIFYLLVNVNDLLAAYVPGRSTIGSSYLPVKIFNLFADLFSVLVLMGMIFFLVRRFIGRPKSFTFNENVKLHDKVVGGGIKRDSLIVGLFILLHVGSRWFGTIFRLAEQGHGDPWLPTASAVAPAFYGWSGIETGIHVAWWITMGSVALFLPYFPRSKHLHLLIAPLNLALERRTPGLSDAVGTTTAPGAAKLTDLPWPQILDSCACIMCFRCQEVCPAHGSGTPLSPSALEINKRYFINENAEKLAYGGEQPGLLEYAVSGDGVWSCTTCYACVWICPVGNEPMTDIVELRRNLVFDGELPDELAGVLRNLDEQGNSFGESARKRDRWTEKLDFKIKNASREPVTYLWYVGDFASYNQSCQATTIKVARVLQAAKVDFGILGRNEKSAGNDVRRAGEEGLFEVLAEKNIQTLSKCDFREILTTDPHTFNTLKNEYPRQGGEFKVKHYSTLLLELIRSGRIRLSRKLNITATYHDPCYLGRYNGIFDDPREVMRLCGVRL
ncbi:MAG: (Fe-S)-binding protein, partial [FCB group bacterium]|nr:(Fe-S)-binding protein [FCB group bacterium]